MGALLTVHDPDKYVGLSFISQVRVHDQCGRLKNSQANQRKAI